MDQFQNKPATQTEATDELRVNRPTCILRIRDAVGDELNAPVPQGCFRVPRSREGKTAYSLFNDDPWYVLAAHMLLGIFLKFRNRK